MKTFIRSAVAAALAGISCACAAGAPDPALQGKKVLLVVHAQAREKADDETLRRLLESRGLAVTLADQADAASKAQGQDLVLVSSSASAQVIGERLRRLPVPVLTCQPELLGELGMTGPRQDADYGVFEKKDHYLYVVNAPHPLAAGLPAGTFVSSGKSMPMNWGKPSLAANVAVTPPGYFDTPVLFGYEKGATMQQGEPAPARRTSFYLGSQASRRGSRRWPRSRCSTRRCAGRPVPRPRFSRPRSPRAGSCCSWCRRCPSIRRPRCAPRSSAPTRRWPNTSGRSASRSALPTRGTRRRRPTARTWW
jgi:hypothetical protein